MKISLIIILSISIILMSGCTSNINIESKNSTNTTDNVSTPMNPDKTESLVIARNFIKIHLNYPDSSEFPGMFDQNHSVDINGNEYTVKDWVLASNSFGVKKKTSYIINLKYKGGEWTDANSWEELNFKFSDSIDTTVASNTTAASEAVQALEKKNETLPADIKDMLATWKNLGIADYWVRIGTAGIGVYIYPEAWNALTSKEKKDLIIKFGKDWSKTGGRDVFFDNTTN